MIKPSREMKVMMCHRPCEKEKADDSGLMVFFKLSLSSAVLH